MARTSEAEILAIMDGCTLTELQVLPFLTAANAIVTKVFATDTGMTTALLEEVEKWFAAHMIASSVWRTSSEEKIGDASVKYTGQWGKKLESTPYGQMVLTLDPNGKMANLGKRGASIYAIPEYE